MLKILCWQSFICILKTTVTIWSSFLVCTLERWTLEDGRRKVFSMEKVVELRYQQSKRQAEEQCCLPVTAFMYHIILSWYCNEEMNRKCFAWTGWLEVSSVKNYYLFFYNSKVSGSCCHFYFFNHFPKPKEHKSCIWWLPTTINWLVWQA